MAVHPIKHSAHSWKLFEALFLRLDASKYPYSLPPMPRGQAINTAMLLNRCQVQWAREQGVPDEMIQRSAKAKEIPGNPDLWFVEISDSPKRQRRNAPNHLSHLLSFIEDSEKASLAPMHSQDVHSLLMQTSPPSDPVDYIPHFGAHRGDAIEEMLTRQIAEMPVHTSPPTPRSPAEELARQKKRESKEALRSMDSKATWTCPNCEMPIKGLANSVILDDGDQFIRVCEGCIGDLGKPPIQP